jgi:hypothetical protein
MTNEEKAARLRDMAQQHLDIAKRLTPMYRLGLIATCRADAAAFLAGAEALERAVWRPISEAHEDFGSIVVIDMADPGNHDIAHVCGRDWEEKTQGMTHFAQLPLLTEEIARAALARLEGK